GRDPRDGARREVAWPGAADGAIDVVARRTPAGLLLRGQEAVEAVEPARALEQHEEGHERDRHDARDDRDHALRDGEGRGREAEDLVRAVVPQRLPDLLDDVVLRLEEAETAAALREVVHVSGDGVDE